MSELFRSLVHDANESITTLKSVINIIVNSNDVEKDYEEIKDDIQKCIETFEEQLAKIVREKKNESKT